MRKLKVCRQKSFVACTMKIQIYITDDEGELVIEGRKCRKLGELRNGTEEVFDITEKDFYVYAIYDKITKDSCNGSILIPRGDRDICVSGKPKLKPRKGNPFVFDEEIQIM